MITQFNCQKHFYFKWFTLDLAWNYLQRLICHKTNQPTNQPTKAKEHSLLYYLLIAARRLIRFIPLPNTVLGMSLNCLWNSREYGVPLLSSLLQNPLKPMGQIDMKIIIIKYEC